ncbi:MAG: arsenite methyltransferase [Opitutaceae bacterium]|jgi:SAM-dependent methyltransferase
MKSNADTKAQPNEVRKSVSKAYGELVSSSCCGSRAQKGAVVEFSGYKPDELASLPDEAVVNSFGCGNPVALAGLKPGNVVLDLGSGAGIDLLLAVKKVGPTGRVIGVDMTDEMIAKARENIRKAGYSNVEVRKGIIEKLPVDNSSVDWVISNCVINLSPEKPKVFSEIARVLKPGGQMLVSDMVAHDLPAELRTLPALYSSCIGGAIPEEDYLAGLRAAGLTDVKVRDRLVYDVDQLYAFAISAYEENPSVLAQLASCACTRNLKTKLIKPELRKLAKTVEGKIWSAKIYARKPL